MFVPPTLTDRLLDFAAKYLLGCIAISLAALWTLRDRPGDQLLQVVAVVFVGGLAAAIAGYALTYAMGAVGWLLSRPFIWRRERRLREAEALLRQDPAAIAAEMQRWAAGMRARARN